MRITQRMIQAQVDRLNRLTGQPVDALTRDSNGHLRTNVGHYLIDFAYGGVELQQYMSPGGAVNIPLNAGHGTKRELYEALSAYIQGIELGLELQQKNAMRAE